MTVLALRRLRKDEAGAISVIGLFMTVFLVGILYYIVGTAQAVLVRQQLQDGTDAAAMTAAIVQAQAMNFTVLLNIAMSVILAVLIAIRMVSGIATFGMAVAVGLAWPTAGASLGLIPPLRELRNAMESLRREVEPSAKEAMRGLHAAANSVKSSAPAVASFSAATGLKASPLGLRGFAAGSVNELPVEDAPYSVLCDHASETVADFAMKPFSMVGIDFEPIDEYVPIGDVTRSITRELASWFCDENGGSAPGRAETITVSYPKMASDESCHASGSEADCSSAEQQRAAALPDEDSGECRGPDCSPSGPYHSYARAARQQCDPSVRRVRATSYLLRRGTVDYVYTGDRWERQGTPNFTDLEYHSAAALRGNANLPPCGRARVSVLGEDTGIEPVVSREFNREPFPDGESGGFKPVCSKTSPPSGLSSRSPVVGDIVQGDYEEITHIFGCTERIEQEIDFTGEQGDGGGDEDRSPKQIIEDVQLGDPRFQVWAIAEREPGPDSASRMVRLPLWGRREPESPLGELRWLGRYGLAQAEFYYAGSGDAENRDAWMWNMSWRARLRRFVWPESEEYQGELEVAAREGGVSQMNELEDVLIDLRSAIAH